MSPTDPSTPHSPTLRRPIPGGWLAAIYVVLLCATITFIQTAYVVAFTIYSRDYAEKRQQMHEMVLHNRPPEGGWSALGANSLNIRIGVVYLAQAVSDRIGLPVLKVYRLIDIASLFGALLILYLFLRRWFDSLSCTMALLFIGCILPATYAFQFFHPWDRIGLLLWVLSVGAIIENRVGWLVPLLVAGVLVKYDAVVLPGLYFLVWLTRRNWLRTTVTTLVLFAVTFGVYAVLIARFPGGTQTPDIGALVASNLQDIARMHVMHATLLGFAIPLSLAFIGFRQSDRTARALFLFAMLLFVPFFLTSHFNEIRAQMGAMILILPAALFGMRTIVARESSPA